MADTTANLNDPAPRHSTQLLLEGALKGDENAWRRIVQKHQQFLINILGAQGNPVPSVEPEDVLQIALIKAFRSMDQFEYQGEGSLRRWLKRIALNTWIDVVREDGRQKRGGTTLRGGGQLDGLLDPAGSPPSEVVNREEREKLWSCLRRLEEDQKELIIMRRVEGLSWEVIADYTRLPRTTCRRRYEQALAILTRWMASE